jgi:hypothetical protein
MILLGAALEFGQELVPGREFEIRDMFINGAGFVTVVVIGILIRRIVPVVGVRPRYPSFTSVGSALDKREFSVDTVLRALEVLLCLPEKVPPLTSRPTS